jgi:hypothetical protein
VFRILGNAGRTSPSARAKGWTRLPTAVGPSQRRARVPAPPAPSTHGSTWGVAHRVNASTPAVAQAEVCMRHDMRWSGGGPARHALVRGWSGTTCAGLGVVRHDMRWSRGGPARHALVRGRVSWRRPYRCVHDSSSKPRAVARPNHAHASQCVHSAARASSCADWTRSGRMRHCHLHCAERASFGASPAGAGRACSSSGRSKAWQARAPLPWRLGRAPRVRSARGEGAAGAGGT